jgi:ribosomal protein L37E
VTDLPHRRESIDCPRCGKPVQADQDWCLNCGAAARTRLLRSPNWRRPLTVLAILAALSLAAFAVSFVDLTNDPTPPKVTPVDTIKTVTATTPTTTTPTSP